MIGYKIKEFDNSNGIASDFRDIFKISLEVPNNTLVEILEPLIGGLRRVKVGNVYLSLDLNTTNMLYSREKGKVVSTKEIFNKSYTKIL